MSEYQYVAFRAVDRPLTDKELKFAEQQSTRAEISRWSFENEYHFGDFRGDVNGLLRHGYDVYLHYANFGIRRLAFRMPAGLPFPKSVWSQYIGIGELTWEKDPRSDAGIVSLSPFRDQQYRKWIQELSDVDTRRLLRRFLAEDANAVKAETIAAIRQGGGASDWPATSLGRSFQALLDRTEQIRAEHEAEEQKKREAAAKRKAAKKERERQDRMKEMVKDPQAWLRKASKLVDARGTANYKAAAEILADLREAVGGDEGKKITRKHAAQLAKKHPTLSHLKSSLRKRGLLE